MEALDSLARIDVTAAARRLEGVLRKTPLAADLPLSVGGVGPIELRLKLESEQETRSFKARGAWNQLSLLSEASRDVRERGVVATSSGNHGRAVAWAARRAGIPVTLYMPENIYPNKLRSCRDEGAEIVLCATRAEAEERCLEHVQRGATLVHPYDAERTVEGAGTVGLEIAQEWPEVEVVIFPVGGGGLLAGSALAIQRELGDEVAVIGVEPEGSPNLGRALDQGRVVTIDPITTAVQGLCPMSTGALNLAIAERVVEGMVTLEDDEIFAAQDELDRAGLTVEPAGAASFAAVRSGALPAELFDGRTASDPLRVCCVVSGANADPAQLERMRSQRSAR